jgi:hypothetical protein
MKIIKLTTHKGKECFASVKGGTEETRDTQGNVNALGKINLVRQEVHERIILRRSLGKQNVSTGDKWARVSIIYSSESRC